MPRSPAQILRTARLRAGISQRALAERVATSQSVVARIELGTTSPTWETLSRLVAAAGFDLESDLILRPATGSHMLEDVARIRSLSPEARLREVANLSAFMAAAHRGSQAAFDPELIFATLARHQVEFVLVGALAARLHGFPRLTDAADLTPAASPENLDRLGAALRELDARVYTESVPGGLAFDCTATTLARADIWNLVTAAGRVDIIFRPAGIEGYATLRANAVRFTIHGEPLFAASLTDILRSKEAADRPQDRQDALIIREMLRADQARNVE